MSERNELQDNERYSVWVHYEDFKELELFSAHAETAVEKARSLSMNVGARMGIVKKIQIVCENDDSTAFVWEYGKGVTFPPRDPQTGLFKEVK